MTTEKLQATAVAPQKHEPVREIRTKYYPQDPLITDVAETTIPGDGVSAGPRGPRVEVNDSPNPPARPDKDGNFLPDAKDVDFQQVASFTTVMKTVQAFERYLGRSYPWAFGVERLTVIPHAGGGFNAYYSRADGSLNFFDGDDPVLGKTVKASESLDVVSHEAGHAILDGIKPGLRGFFGSLESSAFHESFGDMCSVLIALSDPIVRQKFLEQTGGDFRKENLVAYMGEEITRGINDTMRGKPGSSEPIRHAINELKWKDPNTLPRRPRNPKELGANPHDFSRLFTGAFYDVVEGIYRMEVAEGKGQMEALENARDTAGLLLARSLDFLPEPMNGYNDAAQAMLKADRETAGGKYQELVKKVFTDREILNSHASRGFEFPSLFFQGKATEEKAAAFVKEHAAELGVDPSLPFKVQEMYSNKLGETFVRFGYTSGVELKGGEFGTFEGAEVDIPGSLTLGFKEGKLFHLSYRPVTKEAVEETRKVVAGYVKDGLIKYTDPFYKMKGDDFFKNRETGELYAGYTVYQDGKMKIIPTPVMT